MLNARLSEQQKQLGLDLVEENNPTFVETMRGVARMHCKKHGEVTADDLRKWYAEHEQELGVKPSSPNVWGSIFRGQGWEFVRYTKSKQVQRHSNRIGVWRYKEH